MRPADTNGDHHTPLETSRDQQEQLQTLPQVTGNKQAATIGDWQKLQTPLATAEDRQRPLEITGDQQTLLETSRHKWRPPYTTGDQQRPARTTGDH